LTASFPPVFNPNLANLVGKEDIFFSDERNHASIINGSRLFGAKSSVTPTTTRLT